MKTRLQILYTTIFIFALNILFCTPSLAFKGSTTINKLVILFELPHLIKMNYLSFSYLEECDIIVLTNGTEIKSKVIDVTPDLIKYKKCENLTGSTFIVKKSEVYMLKYPNGANIIITQNNVNSVSSDVNKPQKTPVIECDNIVQLNGDEIKSKIIEVTLEEIKYKKCEYLNGPQLTIKRTEVFMLKYPSGETTTITPKKPISLKNEMKESKKIELEKPDSIILVNGDIINAKVLEVSTKAVKYKKFENTKGQSYSIKKSEVFMLKYPDGETKIITQKNSNPIKKDIIQSESRNSEKPDIIILLNGEEISARVLEETIDEIKYKKFENITGPTSTINKSDIFLVKYANTPIDKIKRK
ncbi:MAG TPA: hypothetical protein VK590_14550 [Saprospiraceae bacterium]|nr:hypothetical protein [Saprospiraceae bacterium]